MERDKKRHHITKTSISTENLKSEVIAKGYARFSRADIDTNLEFDSALNMLAKGFDELPIDPVHPESHRYRSYGRYILVPWTKSVTPVPPVKLVDTNELVMEYYQSTSHNPTDGGTRRPFTPLHPGLRTNPALMKLIDFDSQILPENKDWEGLPILVGVHLIRLAPEGWMPACTSPDFFHRDGEPHTIVHLMRRVNITGGMNYVGDITATNMHPDKVDPSKILDTFVLENQLDSFIVDDARVCHHVDPVHAIFQNQTANRDVILIDFTPLCPMFTD